MKTRNRDREEGEEAYLRRRLNEIRQRKLREGMEEIDDEPQEDDDDEAVGWELIPVLEQIEAAREQMIRLAKEFGKLLRTDPRLATLWEEFCANGGTHSQELAAQLDGRQFRHRRRTLKKHLRIVATRPNLNLRKIAEPTPIEHGQRHHDETNNRPRRRS
jgi:hypothetical protein